MFEAKIQEYKDDLIKDLLGCVAINSVRGAAGPEAPFGPGPREALEYTLNLAESMGFRTCNLDNMIGYAEYGEGSEMIGIARPSGCSAAGRGLGSCSFRRALRGPHLWPGNAG